MMKQVLIISREQFGYNTDRYKWCEYLRGKYKVTHLAVGSRKKYGLSGVRQINISGKLPRLIRGVLLFIIAAVKICFLRGTVIIADLPHCEVLKKIFPRKKMIFDVRTMSVNNDCQERKREDDAIRLSASYFDKVTAISEGVATQLNLKGKDIDIIPLGADVLETRKKDFSELHLLYIGTLFNRDIDKTIKGFALAKERLSKSIIMTYDVVGDGPNGEKEQLEALSQQLDMNNYISFHGYVQHSLLNTFLEKDNVGISFVPITPFYEYQPVTKTFEYSLAGLYVIATDTFSNREVVSKENGILIKDEAEAFAEALVTVYNNRLAICDENIRKTLLDYSWERIVNEKLIPIIES